MPIKTSSEIIGFVGVDFKYCGVVAWCGKDRFSEIKQLFQTDLQCLGNPFTTFDGRRVDATFNKTDELDGIVCLFRKGFLRQSSLPT